MGVGSGGRPQPTCKDNGHAAGNVDTPSSRCGRASCAPETGHAAGNERTARPRDGRGRAEAGAKAQRVRLKTEGARATYMDAPSLIGIDLSTSDVGFFLPSFFSFDS